MKSIKEVTVDEIEIQKSRFICYINQVHTEEDAKEKIAEVMQKYPGATHYCYAYIIDNVKRFQDDGEPGGTAGMPILHVLETQNLQHIVAVVVRYFGGIKLGAGGLVRAYTNSVSTCIQNAQIIELEECNILDIYFDYSNVKQVDYLLQDYVICNKDFDVKIKYKIVVPIETSKELIDILASNIDSYTLHEEIIYK